MGDLALPVGGRLEPSLGRRLSSDERLARLVSRGSTWAFALLYQRHHQALYRYARSIVREDSAAQDVLQNTMMRALAALKARERDIAVRPWLFRIAHNEAVSHLRAKRADVPLPEDMQAHDRDVAHVAEQRERLATLTADLQMLTERQRAVLVMRELGGLSVEEIAQAHSSSGGATKQTLYEARCALHELAEGRAMGCEHVRRVISDGDRRALRGRRIRAHLRDCAGCREFVLGVEETRDALRVLAPPLPAVAGTAMLGRLLAHGAAGGSSLAPSAASGVAVGKSAAASLAAKTLAGVLIVAASTAGAVRIVQGSAPHARADEAVRARHLRSHSAGAGAITDGQHQAQPASGAAAAPPRGRHVRSAGVHPMTAATPAHADPQARGAHGGAAMRARARHRGSPSAPQGVSRAAHPRPAAAHGHGGAPAQHGARVRSAGPAQGVSGAAGAHGSQPHREALERQAPEAASGVARTERAESAQPRSAG